MSLEVPPNNETGKIFVRGTSLFWCASLSKLLQSAGYKNPGFQWYTLSVSVVSTTAALPINVPPCIPLCLSWRKEFLAFWYCCFCCHGPWKWAWRQRALLSSGAAPTFNLVRLMTCHTQVPQVGCRLDVVNIKNGCAWCHLPRLFVFWPLWHLTRFWVSSWEAASLLFIQHVRNLAGLILEVAFLFWSERLALCGETGPLLDRDVSLDGIQQLSGGWRNGVASLVDWGKHSDSVCMEIFGIRADDQCRWRLSFSMTTVAATLQK